jgi:hypothetical protein
MILLEPVIQVATEPGNRISISTVAFRPSHSWSLLRPEDCAEIATTAGFASECIGNNALVEKELRFCIASPSGCVRCFAPTD